MYDNYIKFITDEKNWYGHYNVFIKDFFKIDSNIINYLFPIFCIGIIWVVYKIITICMFKMSYSYRESVFRDQAEREFRAEELEKYHREINLRINHKESTYLSE